MYVEELKRLLKREEPNMMEEKKAELLMRGVRVTFAGLVGNPPTTVAEYAQEASTFERALHARTGQYNRPLKLSTVFSDATTTSSDWREIIREVVREEVQRLLPSSQQPEAAILGDIVRDEVQHALGSALATNGAEAQGMTYALQCAVLRPDETRQALFDENRQRWTAVLLPSPA